MQRDIGVLGRHRPAGLCLQSRCRQCPQQLLLSAPVPHVGLGRVQCLQAWSDKAVCLQGVTCSLMVTHWVPSCSAPPTQSHSRQPIALLVCRSGRRRQRLWRGAKPWQLPPSWLMRYVCSLSCGAWCPSKLLLRKTPFGHDCHQVLPGLLLCSPLQQRCTVLTALHILHAALGHTCISCGHAWAGTVLRRRELLSRPHALMRPTSGSCHPEVGPGVRARCC